MLSWSDALFTESNIQYLSGFVGVCLIQYFHKSHARDALVVIQRLLNRKIIFTHSVSRLLKVEDVAQMAVTVSYSSVLYIYIYIYVLALVQVMPCVFSGMLQLPFKVTILLQDVICWSICNASVL